MAPKPHTPRAGSRLAPSEAGVRRAPVLGAKRAVALAVALLVGALFSFYSAARYVLPMGSGGLFAQMSKDVAAANFALPEMTAFYGPGPIPFAYPPLGFYVMAVFLKTGLHPLAYMRWIPPLLSLAAIAPMFLLTEYLTRSSFAAVAACIVLASSPAVLSMHAFAAGAVRGLAFLLLLLGIHSFSAAIEERSTIGAAAAGTCFGLVVLTHLFYGLAFAVWAAAWVIANPGRRSMRAAAACLPIAAAIVAPWLATIVWRHGFTTLTAVVGSHGNTTFLAALGSLDGFGAWIWSNLRPLWQEPLLGMSAALGVLFLVLRRRLALPLAMAAGLWIFSEGERFTVMFAGLAAGALPEMGRMWPAGGRLPRVVAHALLGAATVSSAIHGFRAISGLSPRLHQNTLELADYVRLHTNAHATYLFVGTQDEAEWFPYLLQREPVISKWGAEWTGRYEQQQQYLRDVMRCQTLESLGCLSSIIGRPGVQEPDLLITRAGDDKLEAQLQESPSWAPEARFGRYLVWVSEPATDVRGD